MAFSYRGKNINTNGNTKTDYGDYKKQFLNAYQIDNGLKHNRREKLFKEKA